MKIKRFISMILAFGVVASLCVPAFAACEQDQDSFFFDMEKIAQTGEQEFTFIGEDGEEARIGVRFTPCAVPQTTVLGTYDVTDGEWEIYYYAGIGNCTYNIMITNKKITDAYDLWYFFVGPSCTGSSLTYSSTKASAYFTFQTPIWDVISWNGYLNAEISGGKLKVIVI